MIHERPSQHIKEKIFNYVDNDFNPKIGLVFSKAIIVHTFASLASMSVCPQFGLRVFGEGAGLMHHFMHFGNTACLFLCGAFYISFSVLFIFLILGRFERRVFVQNKWIFSLILSLGSFGLLTMFSNETFVLTGLVWLLATLMTSIAFNYTYQLVFTSESLSKK